MASTGTRIGEKATEGLAALEGMFLPLSQVTPQPALSGYVDVHHLYLAEVNYNTQNILCTP